MSLENSSLSLGMKEKGIAVPFGNGRKDSYWGGDTKENFEVLGDVHVQSISWLHKSSRFGKFFIFQ